MTLSGPNACRGSMKDARIRPHFLHSPVVDLLAADGEDGGVCGYALRIDEGSGLLRKGGMVGNEAGVWRG